MYNYRCIIKLWKPFPLFFCRELAMFIFWTLLAIFYDQIQNRDIYLLSVQKLKVLDKVSDNQYFDYMTFVRKSYLCMVMSCKYFRPRH